MSLSQAMAEQTNLKNQYVDVCNKNYKWKLLCDGMRSAQIQAQPIMNQSSSPVQIKRSATDPRLDSAKHARYFN